MTVFTLSWKKDGGTSPPTISAGAAAAESSNLQLVWSEINSVGCRLSACSSAAELVAVDVVLGLFEKTERSLLFSDISSSVFTALFLRLTQNQKSAPSIATTIAMTPTAIPALAPVDKSDELEGVFGPGQVLSEGLAITASIDACDPPAGNKASLTEKRLRS